MIGTGIFVLTGVEAATARSRICRAFQTPLVPVLPIVAILFLIYLMLNLAAWTWIRFFVWMAIGHLLSLQQA